MAALRGVAVAVAMLLVSAVLAWQPAVGSAEVISSSGPLGTITLDNNLDCQVLVTGDAYPSFYDFETEPGGCGTFLALAEGDEVPIETGTLFGPSPAAGAFSAEKTEFTPVAQTLTGKGTVSEPFTVITKVDADEPGDGTPIAVAELVETDSYVTGQESYETTIVAKNLQQAPLKGTIYHVGDCYLADHDTGYGALNVPVTGSVDCTVTPNDSPPGRIMAFTPVATSGFPVSAAHYVESKYPSFWEYMTPKGAQLPDTTESTTNEDNGMGLSWPIALGSADSTTESATLKLKTTVASYGAPTSSTTAGSCVPSGQIPVTVTAPNGAKAVKYTVDGGPVESVETNAAAQVTITLTPGQHTLEYWAEDLAETQESSHHTLSVTVASGGPSLTITSEQGKSAYLVGEAGSVAIAASGPGLTGNPSATHVAISTETPGSFSVARTAANACGTTSASFAYTVARRTLADLPAPELGKTVNVEPVSGEVFIKLPAGYTPPAGYTTLAGLPTAATPLAAAAPLSSPTPLTAAAPATATESLSKGIGFIPLREARQIPVGSELETTRGVARIATATATVGQQQFGDFGAGIFKLLQQRKQKGLTELDMIDNHTPRQVCATLGKGARTAGKHLSSKVLGRINASAHGHFTVRGQYSAATVRGTVWNVGNRCEGTLTHVTRGVVAVRDFRRRKTITLFTGQSYLARAPVKRG
jgi:hypothetical protein